MLGPAGNSGNERKSRSEPAPVSDTGAGRRAKGMRLHAPKAGREDTAMTNLRALLLSASVGTLAACQQMPASNPGAKQAPATQAVQPVQPVQPAPAPAPPVSTGPVAPALQQQAQKTAMSAVGMLEAGHEDEARTEVQRALATDPNNKLAQNLMRQITADPAAALGRESFNYTVRSNESLSMIAGRFMGDIYSFYILARYNNIAVPRQVAGGQVLRIPGKAPPPVAVRETPRAEPARAEPPPQVAAAPIAAPPAAPPEPTPGERAMRAGEAAERGGDLDRAFTEYRKAASLDQPGAEAKAEQTRKVLVQRYSLNARTAFAKQDLDGAIRGWERVLAVDPANDTAKLEKQRALALKDKAKKL
jgi:LysM domain